MNYCTKGQHVVIMTTGQVGIIDTIITRRTHNKDGEVFVQCGAGGPFVQVKMAHLRECTGIEIKEFEGVI